MENQQPSESAAPTLINHGIKHGIILGVCSMLIVIICYVIDFSFMVTFKFIGIILVIGLGYVIYAGINYRNETGGFISYGKAFQHGLVILAISGLINTAFNILLYHVVDTELGQKMTDAIIHNTEEMMAGFGTPQDRIDQTIEGMKTDMPGQFTVGGLAYGYLKGLISYAIIAVITALFVKKNVPLEG